MQELRRILKKYKNLMNIIPFCYNKGRTPHMFIGGFSKRDQKWQIVENITREVIKRQMKNYSMKTYLMLV